MARYKMTQECALRYIKIVEQYEVLKPTSSKHDHYHYALAMKHLKDEGYVATLDALGDLRTKLHELTWNPVISQSQSGRDVIAGLDSNLADKWQYLRRDHDMLLKALASVASFIPEKALVSVPCE